MMQPPYMYRAVVQRVIDGDTIVVDVDLGFHVWSHNQHIRLLGVHTPELHGVDAEAGAKAKNMLVGWVSGVEVMLRTERDRGDKYGRMLADVFLVDGRSVNQLLRDGAPVGGRAPVASIDTRGQSGVFPPCAE